MGRAGWAVLALTACGAAIRFATLDEQSLWFDEALTLQTVDGSVGRMWDEIRIQALPPLHFALAWVWTRVFGDGEAGLRSLSAAAGTLTVPAAYAAGSALVSRRTGIAVAALVALSPALFWYSQEGRPYALLVLLSTVALAFFGRARAGRSPRDLGGWAIASALALCTHYFALFAIVPQALLLLAASRARRVVAAVAGVGAVGLALAPLALYQREHGGADWIANFPLETRLREAARFFATGDLWPGARLTPIVIAAGVVLAAIALLRSRRSRRGGTIVALGLGIAAGAIPLAGAVLGSDYVLDRNLLIAWVPLAIAAAAGVDAAAGQLRTGSRPVAALGAAAALAILTVFCAQLAELPGDRSRARDDWRAVAAGLGPRAAGRVIVVAPFWQSVVLERYLPGLARMPRARPVREIVVVSYRGALPRPDRLAGVRVPPQFRVVGSRVVHRMSVVRYRASRATQVAPEALLVHGRNGAVPYVDGPG